MHRRPPRSTRTDTLFPYTTLFRSSDREVLPSAERAVVLVRDGFNRGGTAFTFLEVAQAQQAVIDARTRRLELFRRYHLDGVRHDQPQFVDVDRLLIEIPRAARPEERRVGQECASTFRSRWSPYP